MSHGADDTTLLAADRRAKARPAKARRESAASKTLAEPSDPKAAHSEPGAPDPMRPLPPGLRPGELRQPELSAMTPSLEGEPGPAPAASSASNPPAAPAGPNREGEHAVDDASVSLPPERAEDAGPLAEPERAFADGGADGGAEDPAAPEISQARETSRGTPSGQATIATGRSNALPPPPVLAGSPFHDRFAAWTLDWDLWNGMRVAARCGDPEAEATVLRSGCGLVDLSPMAMVRLHGDGAAGAIDRLTTVSAGTMRSGTVRPALLCAGSGGVIAIADIVRLAEDEFRLICDVEVLPWIEDGARGFSVRVLPETGQFTALGLVGPRAGDVLARCGFLRDTKPVPGTIASVARHGVQGRLLLPAGSGGPFGMVGRTDLWIEPGDAGTLWDMILRDAGEFVRPLGLEALETMRVLKGWPRLGRDGPSAPQAIDGRDALDPFDLGLEDLIDWDKPAFSGRAALEARRARFAAEGGRLLHLALPGPVEPGTVLRRGDRRARLTSLALCPVTRAWMGLARADTPDLPGAGPWHFDTTALAGAGQAGPALRADRPAAAFRFERLEAAQGGLGR